MSAIDTKIEELSLRKRELVSQRQKPRPGTSTGVYAPTVRIPEEMCEYDKIRQKNIEERERKFKELGLNEAKTTVANSLKVTKKGKSSKK